MIAQLLVEYVLDGSIDWRAMQTLVRSMPDLHKTLILAHVRRPPNTSSSSGDNNNEKNDDNDWIVDELAMATEHAPFRHKRKVPGETAVGSQRKPGAVTTTTTTTKTT